MYTITYAPICSDGSRSTPRTVTLPCLKTAQWMWDNIARNYCDMLTPRP